MSNHPYAEAQKLAKRIAVLERVKNPTKRQVALLKELRKEFAIQVARM